SSDLEEAAAAYGRHLGTAFQLIDDVLDYSGVTGDIGKNVGDDLREGKATLPLIHVLAHGTAEERGLVREAIERGHTDSFDPILVALPRSGALDYARNLAEKEASLARDAAARLCEGTATSAYRDALLYFTTYSVSRDR